MKTTSTGSAAPAGAPAAGKHSPSSINTASPRTFQQEGKWVERPGGRSKILICTCGNRYLKTRPRQTECLICMRRASLEKKRR